MRGRKNRFSNRVWSEQDIVVPESHHAKAARGQIVVTTGIAFAISVLAAVGLNDEMMFK
jgi:hypothetical protein